MQELNAAAARIDAQAHSQPYKPFVTVAALPHYFAPLALIRFSSRKRPAIDRSVIDPRCIVRIMLLITSPLSVKVKRRPIATALCFALITA
jgi:hypothetical protein